MNQSICWNNYNVDVSLGERTIYMKAINKINFMMYESTVEPKELNLPFEMDDIYQIIFNCFKCEPLYELKCSIDSSLMKLQFHAKIGGFLKTKFLVYLREKMMSNDGQLTIYMNQLEQKCESLELQNKQLEYKCKMIESQFNAKISIFENMVYTIYNIAAPGHNPAIVEYPLNSKEILIQMYNFDNHGWHIHKQNYFNLKLIPFYCLEKLQLSGFNANLDFIQNNNVSHLIVEFGNFAISNVNGLLNMPNLKTLELMGGHAIDASHFISILRKTKIEKIIANSCNCINTNEVKMFCEDNKIKLIIS